MMEGEVSSPIGGSKDEVSKEEGIVIAGEDECLDQSRG